MGVAVALAVSMTTLVSSFRANVVDSTTKSFVFEVVGNTEKVDAFIDLMKPLGLVEVSRTGVAAIARGSTGIEK
mgnify:CR=1 FL=1